MPEIFLLLNSFKSQENSVIKKIMDLHFAYEKLVPKVTRLQSLYI